MECKSICQGLFPPWRNGDTELLTSELQAQAAHITPEAGHPAPSCSLSAFPTSHTNSVNVTELTQAKSRGIDHSQSIRAKGGLEIIQQNLGISPQRTVGDVYNEF